MCGIVLPSRSNDLVGRNSLLDPLHHGKQNIVFSVSEAGNAVDAWI